MLLLSLWRARLILFRSVPGVSIVSVFVTLSLKRHICCQVVCSATVVFVLVFLSPFTGNNGWVKEALTLSKRSSSSIGPMFLELQRVLVLFVWCVTTTFYVMRWKARLRVVVQSQLRSLLLTLTALWHLIMSWRPLSCLRPPSLCWTRWWLPPLWRWRKFLPNLGPHGDVRKGHWRRFFLSAGQ